MASGLKEIGEFGFIRKISRGCLIRSDGVVKAIGDDAAAFTTSPDELSLVTTDLLVERVHFLKDAITGFDLGYKALAVNLSDIAAMGGTAKEAFVSIAIPADCELAYLEDIYSGMKNLARKFEVNILGGDTTSSKIDLIINIAVLGTVPEKELLTRDAAKSGDIIFSTGFIGDSKAGLYLILNNIADSSEVMKNLRRAHLIPEPHLKEGRFLARRPGVHAAIDISDGLSSDLGHITAASHAGARIYAEQIPVSDNLKIFCRQFGFDPIEYALAGGEDYTLACTVAPEKAESIAIAFQAEFQRPLFQIGEITDTGHQLELLLPDGSIKNIAPTGWNHFEPEAT